MTHAPIFLQLPLPDYNVKSGKMIISLSLNITMNQLGGASVIVKFHS